MKKKIYLYLNTMLFLFFILNNSIAIELKNSIKELGGVNAPNTVKFFDDQAKEYTLDKFEGKTLLLVFWATWCGSCIKAMPDLDMLQKDFRKLPFLVIPVSEDYQGIEVVSKYYRNNNLIHLPIYYDVKNLLFKALSITSLPTAILINPEGKMLLSFIGHINWYDDNVRNILFEKIPGNHLEPKNSYHENNSNQLINYNHELINHTTEENTDFKNISNQGVINDKNK